MIIASCELNDQTGHEAGRALLAQLYREAVGEDLPPICIAERGKPYFENSPWHFSISHTKKHAFCALSRNPVGIDAEEMDRNAHLALADKILSPGEKAQYDAAADKRLALLTFWVLKEASAKYSIPSATSSGLPLRPRGHSSANSVNVSSDSFSNMSVRMTPGDTQLTRIPEGANSWASALVSAITAPFVAE